MAVNEFQEINYLDIARTRTTEQFKLENAPVFDRYLQLLTVEMQTLQKTFQDLMQLRSLDTATGEQLDVIGRIVGQDRVLLSADLYEFFGFQGALKAGSYGNVTDPTIGAKWWSLGKPLGGNVQLDDDTYRTFIRAKILKNTTASTSEDFIKAINLIFGTESTLAIEDTSTEPATVMVLFNRHLSDFEKALLYYVDDSGGYPSRLIPKTVGVRLIFGEYVRTDEPISWSFTYDGVSFAYDFPYMYNPVPTYSDRFDESDIDIILY